MFRYMSGELVNVGDAVGLDQLDGLGIIDQGVVENVIGPGSPESEGYGCSSTGGVVIAFSKGDLQCWVTVDEHLVRLKGGSEEKR